MIKKYAILTLILLCINQIHCMQYLRCGSVAFYTAFAGVMTMCKAESMPEKFQYLDFHASNSVLDFKLRDKSISLNATDKYVADVVKEKYSNADSHEYTRLCNGDAQIKIQQKRGVKLKEVPTDKAGTEREPYYFERQVDEYSKCTTEYLKPDFYTRNFTNTNAIEVIKCESVFPKKLFSDVIKYSKLGLP